jgi:hypothetical protein
MFSGFFSKSFGLSSLPTFVKATEVAVELLKQQSTKVENIRKCLHQMIDILVKEQSTNLEYECTDWFMRESILSTFVTFSSFKNEYQLEIIRFSTVMTLKFDSWVLANESFHNPISKLLRIANQKDDVIELVF